MEKDRSWLTASIIKPVEAKRISAEQRLDSIAKFFDLLEKAVTDYNIIPSGCWNADEMGCRLAMVSGKLEILAIKTKKKKQVSILILFSN